MSDSQLGRQLGVAVQSAVANAAAYLSLVTRTNPLGSADDLLRRPDVDAMLREALDESRENALAAVQQAWWLAGAPEDATYRRLLADITRNFASLPHLHGLVRHAHASVGSREFSPGVSEPGSHPSAEAADARSAAVSSSLASWGRQAALRARMTVSSAEGLAATFAALEDARAAGGSARKTWHRDPASSSCIWCRRLDGVTISLGGSFAPYLGGPVILPRAAARKVATRAGSARFGLPVGSPIIYTHPPRLYHGDLQGPILHPFCSCRLEITRTPGSSPVPSWDGGQDGGGSRSPAPIAPASAFLAASDVRGMAEDRYLADLAFFRAAVHELGQVLRRLADGG
jgi:hypothetical protein